MKTAVPPGISLGIVISLLTIVAMFVRNLSLLTIFSPPAGLIALWPILVMALSAIWFAWWQNRTPAAHPALRIGSPFEIRSIAKFGLLFIIIQLAGSLGQRFLGTFGTIGVSIIGGFVSSASTNRCCGQPCHARTDFTWHRGTINSSDFDRQHRCKRADRPP